MLMLAVLAVQVKEYPDQEDKYTGQKVHIACAVNCKAFNSITVASINTAIHKYKVSESTLINCSCVSSFVHHFTFSSHENV